MIKLANPFFAYSNTANSLYCGHSRNQKLVSLLARVHNSGVRNSKRGELTVVGTTRSIIFFNLISVWLVNECHYLFCVPFHRLSKVLKDVKTPFWRVQLGVERAWHCFVLVWLGRLQNMVGVESIHVSNIVSTVEPLLTDASRKQTLGHVLSYTQTLHF